MLLAWEFARAISAISYLASFPGFPPSPARIQHFKLSLALTVFLVNKLLILIGRGGFSSAQLSCCLLLPLILALY